MNKPSVWQLSALQDERAIVPPWLELRSGPARDYDPTLPALPTQRQTATPAIDGSVQRSAAAAGALIAPMPVAVLPSAQRPTWLEDRPPREPGLGGNGTLAILSGRSRSSSASPAPASTAPARARLQENRILVQWNPGSSVSQRNAALQDLRNLARNSGGRSEMIQSRLMERLGQGPVEAISLPQGVSVTQALASYRRRGDLAAVEVDWVVGSQVTANDPYYTSGSQLWGMYSSDSPTVAGGSGTTNRFGSQAEQAWADGRTGSSTTVVGVIDEGIDYTHPDLYLNIWLNPGEISALSFHGSLTDVNGDGLITFPDLNHSSNSAFVSDINLNGRIDAGDLLRDSRWSDGRDGDANGYLDDLVGWDFFNNSNDPFRASDGDNHGTHVAGTIGGIGGNGLGVAGMNWSVQMMPLKFLGPTGGYTSGAIAATNYYANMTLSHDGDHGGKAQYVGTNNSWGGGGYSSTLYNAILNGARVGNLFVAAAGNAASNNDTTATYPANYSTSSALGWDAVVSVASITSSGALSSFSNYGATSVDLGAPGSGILSTVAGGGYANYSGTSMAAPHVSGALALMAASFPRATPQELLQALDAATASTPSLQGLTRTGGRLDVQAALLLLAASQGQDPGDGGGSATYSLSASTNAVNEGAGVSFSLSSTNVPEGTTLVWRLSGIAAEDVVGGQLQGVVTVGADGSASFTVNLAADQLSEPSPEAVTAGLYSDATSSTPLASAAPVTVNDTSQTPVTTTPLILWGTTANDTLTGSRGGAAGADQITGVTASGTLAANLGRGQIDTVTGGAGADLFLLADARGGFYNDGRSTNSGSGDHLRINDFNPNEDRLQLLSGQQYLFRNVTIKGTAFSEIYLGNGDSSFNGRDELVARLEGAPLGAAGSQALGRETAVLQVGQASWAHFI